MHNCDDLESKNKGGSPLLGGFLLSVPTTAFMSMAFFDLIPNTATTFSLTLIAFATGLPWNLISIPFWMLGGNEGAGLATILIHYFSSMINGTILYVLLSQIPVKSTFLKVIVYTVGALLTGGTVIYITLSTIGFN